jgi:hypothetical protein
MSQLVGPGAILAAGGTSQEFTTPFPHKPGEKARDNEGNEYVFVSYDAAVFPGVLVGISNTYKAHPLLGTALLPERVGIAMCAATSVNGGWVQIYGLHNSVQTGEVSDGTASDQTVAYGLIPQTSVGTPSGVLALILPTVTVAQNYIYGMWLAMIGQSDHTSTPANSAVSTSNASGPNTAQPATTSHIGNTLPVFLNYPYVTGVAASLDTSNS